MKRLITALAVVTALSAVPALAADMPIKAPPQPVAAPAYSWTGFYVGANGGYGWKDPSANFTGNDFLSTTLTCGGSLGGTCVPPISYDIRGGLAGLQFGYNWQFNQSWLLGLETDFDGSNISGTGHSSVPNTIEPPLVFHASETVKWFGTVRARAGFLPTSNLLLYATGGLAYGRFSETAGVDGAGPGFTAGGFQFQCNTPGGAGTTNCFVGNGSRTAAGYVVGGGAEYALSRNLSLKGEFLYLNLGHGSAFNVVAQSAVGAAPSSFTASYGTVDFYVARAGVNWKF